MAGRDGEENDVAAVQRVGNLAREETDADLADDKHGIEDSHHVKRQCVLLLEEREQSKDADFPSFAEGVTDKGW